MLAADWLINGEDNKSSRQCD